MNKRNMFYYDEIFHTRTITIENIAHMNPKFMSLLNIMRHQRLVSIFY
jgi:hypothetical protein